MPFETAVALTLIVSAFAIFAAALYRGKRQTRTASH
jgi:hypothetical protein